MNRHLDQLTDDLKSVAAQIDIPDLLDIGEARIADARLAAAVSGGDFPGLDVNRVTVDDFAIAPLVSGGRAPRVRVYRPRGARGPGALVFLHGGAFCLGDLETDHWRCMLYAQETSCAVVSVDYALAPEHPYPAALEDALMAVRGVQACDDIDIDPQRICIGGESAGGCLAAATALRCRDSAGIALCGQMLLFPATDPRGRTASMRDGDAMPAWNTLQSKHMWKHYLSGDGSAVSPYAAPALVSDLTGLPRALVVTAQVDPLRDEGLEYGLRLCAAGVLTEIHNYPGTFHVFDGAAPHTRIAQRALGEQIDFLRAVLVG